MLAFFLLFAVGVLALAWEWLAMSAVNSSRVLHWERAEGVHPRLRALLYDWEANGTHLVEVGVNGGVRVGAAAEATQYALFLAGQSKAKTLGQTPHGHGAALDVWPHGWALRWAKVSEADYQLFRTFADFAKRRHGLDAGCDFVAAFPPSPTNPHGGDLPHVEVPGWQSLPLAKES